jgi:uncharacterized protein (TIGR00369 family)
MAAPGGTLDPLMEFLGFRFEAPGTIRVTVGPEHINGAGILSGAVTYAMVDYAMGSALWAQRNEDEGIATLSISVNYLQTAIAGDIVCNAAVDRRNRSAATLRATVEAEDGRLLLTAIGSFSIFERGRARARAQRIQAEGAEL